MYKDRTVNIIIAAAGSGSRFGSRLPKQFLNLGNETILERSVKAFDENEYVDKIVVVSGENFLKQTEELMLRFTKIFGIVRGGSMRQDSIRAGLREITSGLVLVHDAARPFVTQEVINRVIEATYDYGASVPTVDVKDTIRTDKGTLDRGSLHSVQTPQGFKTEILKEAFEKAYEDGFFGTDDASMVERIGYEIHMVEGDYSNLKITTPEDMPKETVNGEKTSGDIGMAFRVGTGFDVHRLVEDRKCILGGVDIPFEKGLLGHSDADVLVHAIMDAILGAAGLGDIGRHFPDTDDKYKGISSIKLLGEVGRLLDESGYRVSDIDATVICQKPKILPYIEEMKANIADALKLEKDQINLKGTTTEKLGFTGRGEGIASEAVALIYKINKDSNK